MSTIDLLILGIVIERPVSAYDIQKDIDGHHLGLWARVSTPSIYKKVLQLREKGFLSSETVREGNMPEKAVYHVTDAGRRYFESLMEHYSRQAVTAVFDFNVVVANLSKLDAAQSARLFSHIADGIDAARELYENKLAQYADIPLNGRTIIEQQCDVMEALSAWAERFSAQWTARPPR